MTEHGSQSIGRAENRMPYFNIAKKRGKTKPRLIGVRWKRPSYNLLLLRYYGRRRKIERLSKTERPTSDDCPKYKRRPVDVVQKLRLNVIVLLSFELDTSGRQWKFGCWVANHGRGLTEDRPWRACIGPFKVVLEPSGRTYSIFWMEKLLAPYKSMSLSVILYPLDPPVMAKLSESIRNGSTGGNSISSIPVQNANKMRVIISVRRRDRSERWAYLTPRVYFCLNEKYVTQYFTRNNHE